MVYSPCCSTDDDHAVLLQFGYVKRTEVGGQTDTSKEREGNDGRLVRDFANKSEPDVVSTKTFEVSRTRDLDNSHCLACNLALVNNPVLVPSERSGNLLTLLPFAALALDDLGDSESGHGLTLENRRRIETLRVGVPVHPCPLSWVVGEMSRLNEDLTVLEFGKVSGLETKGG